MVEEPEYVSYYATNTMEEKKMDMKNWRETKKFQEKTFYFVKEHLLFDLSTEMRSSCSFAE